MKKYLLTLAAATALTASGISTAAAVTGTANVQLLTAVSISEDTQIDFGTIGAENGNCDMASGGALTGSSGQNCSGTETAGSFTVSGEGSENVTITLSAGAAVDGVTFNPLLGSNGASSDTATLSVGGAATVEVIGGLVLSSATTGTKAISYTFTANYP